MPGLIPDPVQVEPALLDPSSNRAINEYAANSQKSPDQLAAEHMHGAADAGTAAMGSQESYQAGNTALGMDNDGTSQALRNQYMQQVGGDTSRMANMTKYEAQMEAAKRMTKAQSYMTARQNIETEAKKMQIQSDAANAQARGSVLGGLLGTVGMLAGSYFGGPLGGQAGNAWGSKAGDALSGQGATSGSMEAMGGGKK